MRLFVAAGLFVAIAAALAVSDPALTSAQDKKDDKKKADPKTFIPDAATLKTIKDKTEELRKAVAALKAKKLRDDVFIEVEIYLKAAENIVRFEEWLAAASVKWALTTLDQGLARAKQAEGGKAVWRDAPGKWVVRAYRSKVDESIQPYAVLLPHDYKKDAQKKWRLDIVLHGRDGALTEAKFIASHQGTAPKDLGYIQLEVYGRGNNAYRWAGEEDVWEAERAFSRAPPLVPDDLHAAPEPIDGRRTVLRGFSMGGAGTWHLGLHHPFEFNVIGPGAGFTTTHGYIAALPKQLPDYQEKCLHIYDAVDYAENAFNVPVVAYSGEIDAQKKAADNIESLVKNFKEPVKFTHLVAPGLAHQMPKEWQDKAEAEYRKYADKAREPRPERVRFVTYTTRYSSFGWGQVLGVDEHYKKTVIDGTFKPDQLTLKTENARVILVVRYGAFPGTATVDGQSVPLVKAKDDTIDGLQVFVKTGGKWGAVRFGDWVAESRKSPQKTSGRQGPIDDAFTGPFSVVGPTGEGWYPTPAKHAPTALAQFSALWNRYFRGALPTAAPAAVTAEFAADHHLVLFGDPQSNPLIAKVLPKLPITWTKEELVVNGVKYDPKTHVPVLIYPSPLNLDKYVVLNSGHTFKEADLKGTNALLYPRLGDWAVIKPTPTDKDPAAYEVVAAGLFDESWQFPKKK